LRSKHQVTLIAPVHVSQLGPTGWLETAVITPMGVALVSSVNTTCGRSRVAKARDVPSVKCTVQLYG
jgi:hypothetical protein